MKLNADVQTKRILFLLKLDSTQLMQKISGRQTQYLSILSIRRTRTHFLKIFENSYKSTSFEILKSCPMEIIEALHFFYKLVDDMEWYLGQTEDLPGAIKDKTDHFINNLTNEYDALMFLINKELDIKEEPQQDLELDLTEIPEFFEAKVQDEELSSEISEEVLEELKL